MALSFVSNYELLIQPDSKLLPAIIVSPAYPQLAVDISAFKCKPADGIHPVLPYTGSA
ncbi:hypothetical protein MK131_15025 [Candidatus Poribacteria bacterium]|nr:hypothetical protein [Candidatus Poribacteria bacterium]